MEREQNTNEGFSRDCPAEEDLPQLPDVAFEPITGTPIGSGLSVVLSVPFHSDASIRFTQTVDGSTPPDPSFDQVISDPTTGIDFDGLEAPITVSPQIGGSVKIKAIAFKPGYRDSNVTLASFPGS